MSTTLARPATRPAALLAAVLGLHAGVLMLVLQDHSGWGGWLETRLGPITIPPPAPLPPVARPPAPSPEAVEPGRVPEPWLDIPAPASEVDGAAAPDPVSDRLVGGWQAGTSEAEPPRLRTRDLRLQALVDACYPAAARRHGREGRGVARVQIDAQGRAAGWRVDTSTGHGDLDIAMGCVLERVQFDPARRDGRAAESVARLPLAFRLR